MQALAGEIRAWVRLRHENVVSLLGTMLLDSVPSLVSEWMENGTVVTYLKAHKDADRLALVRTTLYLFDSENTISSYVYRT
jgi:hypothetical protein